MNYQLLINGAWTRARSGRTWTVVDPATEEPVAEVPFGDARDAEAAVEAAAAAQPGWAAHTPYQRGAVLRRAAELLRERIDEIAPVMTRESGKPLAESRAEWAASADVFEWFAEESKRAYGRVIPARNAAKRLFALPVPVGVVATITAWNFPAMLAARKWAAALAAGCTVVGRPSELTPLSAIVLGQILVEAGIPPGVLNVVNGEPAAIGEVFTGSPLVDKISFTGSQAVGKLLMRNAADGLKRLALELGGSAPVLVFEDCDIGDAANRAVAAKFRNNGQVCISPSRFFVQHSVLESFLEHASNAIDSLVPGHGLDPKVTLGPLVTAAGRERVEGFVADAVSRGAEVVRGGRRATRFERGFFYEPTLLVGLNDEMRAMQEEVFGPVMLVKSFSTLADGLKQANATPSGLAAFVIGRDMSAIVRAYEGLRFGIVGVNDLVPATAEAPFGGMRGSGWGRENAQEGLHEYLETKFVSIAIEDVP